MSSEIKPEKGAAALNDRLFAAFYDGLELIAIQAGYRLGWYSALAQHGPWTASQLSALSETGPRFTKEWLRQQTAAGILDADISASEPTFRLSLEVAAVLLGKSGAEGNTLAALLSEALPTGCS
jgi:hypothetical protein